MTLENFVAIVGAVGMVVGYIVYRYFEENVYLKYKEQRAWPEKAKGGKKR